MFCPKCGKEPGEGSFVCDSCGIVLKRPKSINTAAIIELIAGILSVFLGFLFMTTNIVSKGLIKTAPPKTIDGSFMAKYGLLFSNGLIAWGIICLIVWFGLRRLKRWAGILGIAECIASLLIAISVPFLRDALTIGINLLIIVLIFAGWKSLR